MAYRDFTVGQVLTSQQVDEFLMRQTVMVFADSAARSTALADVTVQGMLTYLLDTSTYESWTGAAWVNISNPGDITAVTAGTGLTGGGTSGDVTLNVDTAQFITSDTVTTAQDLIVADGASSVTRLGVGANDQVLSVVAGDVAWADAAGGGSMTLISTTSLTGSSITLSSIPQTYQALKMVLKGQYYASNSGCVIRFNSVTSSSYNTDSTFNSSNLGFGGTFINIENSVATISRNSLTIVDLPNYTDTTEWKSAKCYSQTNTIGSNNNVSYRSTNAASNISAAITSIDLFPEFANFSGGTVQLFGVN